MAENEKAPEKAKPIDIATAVRTAVEYFSGLYQHPFTDLALEEVEKSNDEQFWLITVGYSMARAGGIAAFTGSPRQYKVIKIDAHTGEPKSMKVKKL